MVKNDFIKEEFDKIVFSNLDIKTNLKPKNITLEGNGKYSLDEKKFNKITIGSSIKNDQTNLSLDFLIMKIVLNLP